MTSLFHNKIKGFGLFEIVISLAIFAVGVITITSLNVRTYRVIKNNELMDFADRTMVKSLEYFKSPTTNDSATTKGVQAQLETWMLSSKVANVAISQDSPIDDSKELVFVNQSSTKLKINESCFSSSLYKLKIDSNSLYGGLNICEQVIIEKKDNGYVITSIIVYQIDGETKTRQLIGYRPFTYEENL
jgi:hypothetical protein